MKLSALALLSVIGVAAAARNQQDSGAGRPQLSISVRDGEFDGLDGLDPTLSWESSARSGDIDLEYGVEASVQPTSDLASLPRKIWGKATTDVSGWGVSARAEMDAQDRSNVDLQIDADSTDNDLSVNMVATAGDTFAVKSVEATKGIDQNGARITVNPRYNMETEEADVVVNYDSGDTNVKLTASADNQEVTISQQVDDDNRIAPTLTSNGDISVEWERTLGDDSSLTATLKPNESIDVEWKDNDWTANVNMPVDGTSINGANVSIKRDVRF